MDTTNSDGEFRHIPFRFYSSDDGPFIQKLVRPFTEDGQPKTLQNLLQDIYPTTCDTGKKCRAWMSAEKEINLLGKNGAIFAISFLRNCFKETDGLVNEAAFPRPLPSQVHMRFDLDASNFCFIYALFALKF